MKRDAGFTLIELLLTTLIFVFAILGATQMFTGLLNQYKQESKIVETNVEGIVGLEQLRYDIESAGYGLPWMGLTAYDEVDSSLDLYAAGFNDSTTTAAPRAILSDNGTADTRYVAGSDYLVIKAVNVAQHDAGQKWTFLYPDNTTKVWDPVSDNIDANDRVIVLSPGINETNSRALAPLGGGGFSALFSALAGGPFVSSTETRIVYPIDPSAAALRMPFNRADYFVKIPAAGTDTPKRCAAGTGILYKGIVSHSDGSFDPVLPLLDCVADMQVIYIPDLDNNGQVDTAIDDIALLDDTNGSGGTDAQEVREQIKEVRVYILAQEGQYDSNYTHTASAVWVGDGTRGRNFNLTTITDWDHYRWKLYTLVVRPGNLM